LNSFANFLVPFEQSQIKAGDSYWVVVESSKSEQELEALVNKRIHDVVYVDEFKTDGGQRQFHIIVLDAPKKASKADKYEFELRGFEYTGLKGQQDPNFIVIDKKFEIEDVIKSDIIRNLVITLIVMLIVCLLFYLAQKIIKKNKEKKEFKEIGLNLKEKVLSVSTRKDIEEIFKDRDQILKYLDMDQNKFKKICLKINEIQFKKDWSNEEEEYFVSEIKGIEVIGLKNGI
jgi:hypothetical protein